MGLFPTLRYHPKRSEKILMRKILDIQPKGSVADIRVISSNVYFHYFKNNPTFTDEDKDAHADLMADTLASTNADVLLLQEVSGRMLGKNLDYMWHERLDPRLEKHGYTMADPEIAPLPKSSADAGNPENVNYTPIWYRADVLEVVDCGHRFYDSVALNPDAYLSSSKSYTWVLFKEKATGKQFIAFSTHLTWHGKPDEANLFRVQDVQNAMRKMAELAEKYPNVPMMLMGDCNCVVGSDPYREFTQYGLINSKDVAKVCINPTLSTIHGLGSTPGYGTIIDHAMITDFGLNVKMYQTLANLNVINMSDHLPVGIGFTLE